MRFAICILLLSAAPALAKEPLTFDTAKLCAWQNTNNAMDVGECTSLETEAQAAVAELEDQADATRKDACIAEAQNYSGDSGFASYTVYASCLKNGPGSL